ncbi:MAG: signal recognition particle receptor subunit alpha, partial [Desulfurococcaceae archaeon]
MVLDGLRNALAKFLKSSRYEEAVEDFIKDLQKELIKSDVNINVVVEISKRIRDRALKEEPPIGVSRKDWFITIVYEELTNLFGGSEKPNIKPSK